MLKAILKIILLLAFLFIAFIIYFSWSPGMYVAKNMAKLNSNGLAKNVTILNSTKLSSGVYKETIFYTYNDRECIADYLAKLENFSVWHTMDVHIRCTRMR